MPPKGKAEKVIAPVEDADPTEEEMQGKVVLTILLQSTTALWEANPNAKLASVVLTIGGQHRKEGAPVTADEHGSFPFMLRKIVLYEPGYHTMQELLNSAVVATLYNASTTDPKTGAPVPFRVGECQLDLSPLLSGATECGGQVAVTPLHEEPPPGAIATLEPEAGTTFATFTATLREPLIDPEDAKGSTIISYTAEAVPVPRGMVRSIQECAAPFQVAGTFPWDGQQAHFKGGRLVKLPVQERRSQHNEGAENEGGAPPEPEEQFKLVWEVTRFWMPKESVAKLKRALRQGESLSFELARYLRPERVELNDPYFAEHHCCGKLAGLEALLEPGQCKASLAGHMAPFPLVTATDDNPEAPTPSLLPEPAAQGGKATVPDDITDRGVCAWELNSSQLRMDMELTVPLVAPWEAPPVPKHTLNELLPKLPPPPKVTPKQEAGLAYRAEIKAAVATIADEYVSIFGTTKPLGGDTDARRKKLVFELNRNGQYLSLKEKIKTVARRVVKEQFTKTPNMSDRQLQLLWNNVYSHLLDEMHAVLRALQSGADPFSAPARPPVGEACLAQFSLEKLRMLADEYETADDADNAARYHQQCLLIVDKDPETWYDYARFCMRAGQLGRAEQALRQVLALLPAHHAALMALTALHLTLGELENAEVYAREAQLAEPESAGPWLLLAFLYEDMDNEHELLKSEWEYKRLMSTSGEALFMDMALKLLDLSLAALAARCLKAEPRSVEVLLCLARACVLEKALEEARAHLEAAAAMSVEDPRVMEMMGHFLYQQGDTEGAEEAYQKTVAYANEEAGVNLQVYLRLGEVYMRGGKHDEARRLYLAACDDFPCRCTWQGLGVAYYMLGMMSQAEDAFTEANRHDYLNPTVWGWLALTSLEQEREDMAVQALDEAYQHNLRDPELLSRIGSKYIAMGMFKNAEGPLRKAVQFNGGVTIRVHLAEALLSQNNIEGAKNVLQSALDESTLPADRITLLKELIKIAKANGAEEEVIALGLKLETILADEKDDMQGTYKEAEPTVGDMISEA